MVPLPPFASSYLLVCTLGVVSLVGCILLSSPSMHPQTCVRFLFRSSLNIQKGFYSIMCQRLISSVYILLLVKFKGWKQY